MSFVEVYHRVLSDAANGTIEACVDEGKGDYFLALKELYKEGYIDAIDEGTFKNEGFRDVRMRVKGREYLNELNKRMYEESWKPKIKRTFFNVIYWASGVLSGVLIMRIGG